MTLLFVRSFFLILCGIVGYYVGSFSGYPILGTQVGFLSGLVLIFLEQRMQRVSVRGLSSMVFGLLLGVVMAKLISDILALLPLSEFVQSVARVVLTIIFSYLGAVMALRGKDEFNIIIPYVRFRRQDVRAEVILLDTSVIIDGRISDVSKTNFLAGRLVVPQFVLQELQQLADSENDVKRQRGRRGMDILRAMQKDPTIDIHIHEEDILGDYDVDSKLVRLAKLMDARICTVDFNLSRVATIQGIDVLNVNKLVEAVRSVIYVGEVVSVKLTKEGKEDGQAIGYRNDGTMVVVKDARHKMGETLSVVVTSVLQTQTGKMIFADIYE